MAITQVQAIGASDNTDPLTLSFSGSTPGPSGNAASLILVTVYYVGTFVSITDDISNSYTQIGVETDIGGGGFTRAYWAKNAAAGTRTVTMSVTSASFGEIHLEELRLDTFTGTAPIDNFNVQSYPNVTSTQTISATMANSTTCVILSAINSAGSLTLPSGYTQDFDLAGVDGGRLDHQNFSTSGSKSADLTNTSFPTPVTFRAWLIGVQETAGGGASDPAGPSQLIYRPRLRVY